MAAKQRRPRRSAAPKHKHRAMVVRMYAICVDLREGSSDLAITLPLQEEFAALAWQLGYFILPPDEEIQAELAKHGWLLRPFPERKEDPQC